MSQNIRYHMCHVYDAERCCNTAEKSVVDQFCLLGSPSKAPTEYKHVLCITSGRLLAINRRSSSFITRQLQPSNLHVRATAQTAVPAVALWLQREPLAILSYASLCSPCKHRLPGQHSILKSARHLSILGQLAMETSPRIVRARGVCGP
ncbi:unnamed protein product [Polarella glacialis]|uniref:Uncharacterized protein n=1 Tax=Polarella glacialis TaxID=89957 RepID=A0A813H4Q4_POLGL|nr:unnamed protein product [Polarella glacialis]